MCGGLTHTTAHLYIGLERVVMNWSFLIAFGIGLGCYFLVLGIIVLVKFIRNKKKLEKEIQVQGVQNNVEEQNKTVDNKE